MTPCAVIREVDGLLKKEVIDELYQPETDEFILTVCSLDICGYTETMATPSVLIKHEKERRRKLQQLIQSEKASILQR